MADFVDDDDGAGYAEELNAFGKRPNGHLDAIDGPESKRAFSGSVQGQRLTHLSSPAVHPGQAIDDIFVCIIHPD